jgi:hypothetical protein
MIGFTTFAGEICVLSHDNSLWRLMIISYYLPPVVNTRTPRFLLFVFFNQLIPLHYFLAVGEPEASL